MACGTDKWENGFVHPDNTCDGRDGAAYFKLDGNEIVQVEPETTSIPIRIQALQFHIECGTDSWENGFIHPDSTCSGRGGAAYFELDGNEIVRVEPETTRIPIRIQASQFHVTCGTDSWEDGFVHPDGSCGGRGGAAYFELDGNDIVQVDKDESVDDVRASVYV